MVRLLEPLRIYHRQPMYIMSGYRSEELNRLVGGAPSSQHMKGEAVDIYTVDRNRLLEDLVASCLNFDQAILYRTKGFIHLSLKKHGVNRKQILLMGITAVAATSHASTNKEATQKLAVTDSPSSRMAMADPPMSTPLA